MVEMIGNGIYTVSEAARLTNMPGQRVRAWFHGAKHYGGPLLVSDYRSLNYSIKLLSFADLIEVLVLGQLRQQGLSLPYLRKVHKALRDRFGKPHPFALQDFQTDGRKVFVEEARSAEDRHLMEIVSKQCVIEKVVRPYLHQVLDYDLSGLAKRWRIQRGVLVDPELQFGQPVVEGCRIPTAVIALSFVANNQNPKLVAQWFEISQRQVELAVQFEKDHGWKAA